MSNPEIFKKFGKFVVAPGSEVDGELRVAGSETSLYLRADNRFEPHSLDDRCITGTLYDLTKVTLLKCQTIQGLGSSSRNGARYYYAKFFPHFVLEGQRHIAPSDRVISRVTFFLEDAAVLFYDFDAFGSVIDAEPYIEQIATANNLDRPIAIGPEPIIAYFTGKRNILEFNTVLGRVSAQHNPSWNLGGPRGIRIDNDISVNFEPTDPITFDEAIARTLRLVRFLELIIGRSQNFQKLIVFLNDNEPLRVYWSYAPARQSDFSETAFSPQPADLLLDPIRRVDEFASVTRNWLEKDEDRLVSRQRFHTSFALLGSYSVEKLIGAANMFDILPESAVPTKVTLSDDLQVAKEKCRKIFQSLPRSDSRDSLLNALARLGMPVLKDKTSHRAKYVIDAVGEWFPDLVFVLNAAVDCRNHYVHGKDSEIDYSRNLDVVQFFTDTLEFVFGASELIEAGWAIRTFIERGTTMSHPYGKYFVTYAENLRRLRRLVENT